MTPRRAAFGLGVVVTLWILGGWLYLWPYYPHLAGPMFLASMSFKEITE